MDRIKNMNKQVDFPQDEVDEVVKGFDGKWVGVSVKATEQEGYVQIIFEGPEITMDGEKEILKEIRENFETRGFTASDDSEETYFNPDLFDFGTEEEVSPTPEQVKEAESEHRGELEASYGKDSFRHIVFVSVDVKK